MLKSKTNKAQQHYDAPSLGAELITLQGSTRQLYYVGTRTYEDDRTLVPCVLYADMQSAARQSQGILTGVEWYNRPPVEGDYITGRIVNPDESILNSVDVYEDGELVTPAAWRSYEFLIADGSNRPWCAGLPTGALIVRKNMPAKHSFMIYGVIKGADVNTGNELRIQRHVSFDTELYDDATVTISGSWGRGITIDPLGIPEPVMPDSDTVLDEPWWRQVTAQLHGVEGDVPAAEACYLWLIADATAVTGFRQFTEAERELMAITGERTATLRFDARMIAGETTFRCYGCRLAEGDEWTNPLADEKNPFYETTITMEINDTLEATPRMLYGAAQNADMSNPCAYEMDYRYNNRPVPAEKKVLMQPLWKGSSLRTGAEVTIMAAPNLMFTPSMYGFTFPEGFAVNADVLVYAGCAAVVSDGKYVKTSDDATGRYVISPTYK